MIRSTPQNQTAKCVIRNGDANIDQDINVLHHTHSLKILITTQNKYMHNLKLIGDNDENPLDFSRLSRDKFNDGANMTFMGHPTHPL